MKYHLSRLDKLLLIRCLMGQLPIIGILSIFLSQEFFTLPLLTKVVIILILTTNMGITIYFTKEIKLEQAKENTHFHAKVMQISFIVIALIFGFIDLYRGRNCSRNVPTSYRVYRRFYMYCYSRFISLGVEIY